MNKNADNHYFLEKVSSDGINTFECPEIFLAHWHRMGEILYIKPDLEGFESSAKVLAGDVTYKILKGDILFIPSEQIHEVKQGCRGALLGLQYDTSILSSQAEFLPYISRFSKIALLKGSELPDLTGLLTTKFEKIRRINDSDAKFKRMRSNNLLCESFMVISDYIDERYSLDDIKASVGPGVMDAINKVCEYANDNLTSDPSLTAAAEYAGLSASYLSRTFKTVLNVSYTEYVNRRKVSLAISLLAQDTNSITDICYMAGFNSISTFNRVFLSVTGLSPGQFRKYNANI